MMNTTDCSNLKTNKQTKKLNCLNLFCFREVNIINWNYSLTISSKSQQFLALVHMQIFFKRWQIHRKALFAISFNICFQLPYLLHFVATCSAETFHVDIGLHGNVVELVHVSDELTTADVMSWYIHVIVVFFFCTVGFNTSSPASGSTLEFQSCAVMLSTQPSSLFSRAVLKLPNSRLVS